MYHFYQMYLATMSARFFHSADLDGLSEGLTASDDAPPTALRRGARNSTLDYEP